MFGNKVDRRRETDCLDSITQSVSLRVKYSRSLKWKRHLIHQHTIGFLKSPVQCLFKKPISEEKEDVVQPKLAGKRTKAMKRKTSQFEQPAESMHKSDRGSDSDPISSVYDVQDAKCLAENDGEWFDMADHGSADMDVDSDSDNWSITSGPSCTYPITQEKMCSACMKLFQKAKNIKTPLKKKRQNYDPKSLSCDQWALIKKWAPRRFSYGKGKLVKCIESIKKRHNIKAGLMSSEQQESCSRPHPFLQRNLRSCALKPLKCSRKKKRKKVGLQGSGAVKHQHLHGIMQTGCACDAGLESAEVKVEEDKRLTVKGSTSTVSVDKTQKPALRFRDLLVQQKCNGSMIIRETH